MLFYGDSTRFQFQLLVQRVNEVENSLDKSFAALAHSVPRTAIGRAEVFVFVLLLRVICFVAKCAIRQLNCVERRQELLFRRKCVQLRVRALLLGLCQQLLASLKLFMLFVEFATIELR